MMIILKNTSSVHQKHVSYSCFCFSRKKTNTQFSIWSYFKIGFRNYFHHV